MVTAIEKFKYLCNQVEATNKIKHVFTTYTSYSVCVYGIKISTILKKNRGGDEA